MTVTGISLRTPAGGGGRVGKNGLQRLPRKGALELGLEKRVGIEGAPKRALWAVGQGWNLFPSRHFKAFSGNKKGVRPFMRDRRIFYFIPLPAGAYQCL